MATRKIFLKIVLVHWVLFGTSAWSKPPVIVPLVADADPTPEVVLSSLSSVLRGKGDFIKRHVRRLPAKTLEMQAFISLEGTMEMASKILPDFINMPGWIINRINESPTGRSYYFQIQGAKFESPDVISFNFLMDLPVFKQKGIRKFRVRSEKIPNGLILTAGTLPNPESMIHSTEAKLYVFPAIGEPGRLWMAILSRVIVKSWLLYEALPERLIQNESAERLETIVANFQLEEAKQRKEK